MPYFSGTTLLLIIAPALLTISMLKKKQKQWPAWVFRWTPKFFLQEYSIIWYPFTSGKRGNRPGPFGPLDPVPEPGPTRRD
jgi:hypothetical protein